MHIVNQALLYFYLCAPHNVREMHFLLASIQNFILFSEFK